MLPQKEGKKKKKKKKTDLSSSSGSSSHSGGTDEGVGSTISSTTRLSSGLSPGTTRPSSGLSPGTTRPSSGLSPDKTRTDGSQHEDKAGPWPTSYFAESLPKISTGPNPLPPLAEEKRDEGDYHAAPTPEESAKDYRGSQQHLDTADTRVGEKEMEGAKPTAEAAGESGEKGVDESEDDGFDWPLTTFVHKNYTIEQWKEWVPEAALLFIRLLPKYYETATKERMRDLFKNDLLAVRMGPPDEEDKLPKWQNVKESCGLEGFDDQSFLRILSAWVSMPSFRKEYGLDFNTAFYIHGGYQTCLSHDFNDLARDLDIIWAYFNPKNESINSLFTS